MNPLKKLLLVVITLVSISSLSLLILTHFIKPDLIRDYVEKELATLSSLPCQINGDIHWQIFPQPGIRVNQIVIGSPDTNMPYTAKIHSLFFNLDIKPLLAGKLVFSELKVNGLELAIHTSYQRVHPVISRGKGIKKEKTVAPFVVQHVVINGAALDFEDERKSIKITTLQLGIEQLNPKTNELPLQVKVDLAVIDKGKPAFSARSSFKGNLHLTPAFMANPLANLSDLQMNGQILMQNLQLKQLSIHRLGGKLHINQGILSINPLTMGLYQGEAVGSLTYHLLNKTLKINQTGTGLQSAKFLQDFLKQPSLRGLMDFSFHAEGFLNGLNPDESLAGDGTVTIHEGFLDFINLDQLVARGSEKINQYSRGEEVDWTQLFQGDSQQIFKGSTPFQLASVNYQFNPLKWVAKSLVLQTETLSLKGDGELLFPDYAIHSNLLVTVSTDNKQMDSLQQLLGGGFPLSIKGSLFKPLVLPAVSVLTPALTRQWVGKTLSKPVRKIKKHLGSLVDSYLMQSQN